MTARVEHGRAIGGAREWVVVDGSDAVVCEVRADVDRLSADDLAELIAAVERIAMRRRLRAVG